jgi:short chain dehydrogenase
VTLTALVTGGNRGIGLEAWCQLARAGITVVLATRDPHRGQEAAQKMRDDGLEVEYQPGSGGVAGRLMEVRHPELFETAYLLPQPRLFGLEVLGKGWLKAPKLGGYAPRRTGTPRSLQQAPFACGEDAI